ncbi:flagellar hook-associated protein FlgL [Pengzhenrongella frigida]|uniref:Flagellar hook-associated protein 3 n=1 Tax=Pengzhenrongella frigida TaxID=1259133 RepID=A0A4Q5MWT2_9MICO|nr:flagellar hook-associated protein FlgL [Cellulomonas sp. HLT2-17]RYV50035.1 flagellar hook-associated protein 3 [Cellulomonas sp. HLT2-17]
MIGRVTQQTTQRSTLANLQKNLAVMADLQNKLSGNTKIARPSDDPAGTASAITLRAELRANTQASRNIDDGNGWLTTGDTALNASLDALRQARDLTVQGSNSGALNPQAREALAVQLEGLRQTLLSQANTTYQGRQIFAGTSNAAGAVTVVPADPAVVGSVATYTMNGTADTVNRRVDANTLIRVDVDGAKAFGAGAASVFATLDRIALTLRSGGEVTSELDTLDAHRDAMLTELGGVGARQSQVLGAETRALATKTELTTQLSSLEDVDLAASVVELQMQEVAYKAALGATARVLQPSLLDFLR